MKKFVAFLLVLTLAISAVCMPAAAAFNDVSDRELTSKLDLLQALGIVGGYPDNTYRPAKNLSRAEFTKFVVTILGGEDASLAYADYTSFPDVRSIHWAARYVNYAARELQLIKGNGTGYFKPDDPIPYREALTIVMRGLGYTDEVVGGRWPDGYFAKAAALGLTDGITLGRTQPVSRAAAAELFYNALYVQKKDGGRLIDSLAGKLVENVLILSVNATAADGAKNAVITADGSVYKTESAFSADYVGRRGTLILNGSGLAVGFTPSAQTVMTLIVARTDAASLTAADGTYLRVDENAPVYTDGAKTPSKWADAWHTVGAGSSVRATVGENGRIEYLTAASAELSTSAVVLETIPTFANLCSMLGAPTTAKIIKNGIETQISELQRYDVASYNSSANTIQVSDFRITAVYESAHPSAFTPDTVTTLCGNTFDALESAADSLKKCGVGTNVTLLFTADGKIAGAVPSSTGSAAQVGFYDGSSVIFPCGISIKASLADTAAGQLIRVYQAAAGRLSASVVSITPQTTGAWDLSAQTIGGTDVLPGVLVFERLGLHGTLNRIAVSDIAATTVPANRILYSSADSSGRINIIVVEDVTGEGYVYGRFTSSTREADERTINEITVANGAGSKTYESMTISHFRGDWGAAALTKDGRIQFTKALTGYSSVAPSAFGAGEVLLGGVKVRFADEVQVYISSSASFLDPADYSSVSEMIGTAKNMGSRFTLLLDRIPADGGLIRIMIVE